MEEVNQDYLKGFNVGYLLSEHDPKLLSQILKTKSSKEYFNGLESGKKQHDREKLLNQVHKSQNTHNNGLER
jgi:hypothetical protein